MSMRTSRRATGWAVLVGVLATRLAGAQTSPQEKRRNEILDELGLKKKPPAPPPAADVPAPADEEAPAASGAPAAPGGTTKEKSPGRPAGPAAPSFTRVIHPLLTATCKVCHSPVGPAAQSHFLLSGDPAADHHALVRFVDTHNPDASVVLAKVSGKAIHGGGAPWPAASAPHERLLAWIRGGARLDAARAPEPPSPQPVADAVDAKPGSRRRQLPPPAAAGVDGGGPAATPTAAAAPLESAPIAAASPARPAPGPDALKPNGPSFATVHPSLMTACALCHRPGGPAAMTRFLLSGDPVRDEAVVRALVDPQAPEQSLLVTKASGQMHGGGPVFPPGDPRLATVLGWVAGLAPPAAVTAAPGAPVNVAPAAPSGASSPPLGAPPGNSPGPHAAGAGPPGGSGLPLPFGFMLNGRFDLNYERRQFTGNPYDSGSVAALRSYHHFLFLSRDAGDPCGLTVEVITLLFWEGHCRLPRRFGPVAVTIAAGKIVVPFGADPLYHQSYGGLAGFDQVVLPPVWAIEGAAVHAVFSRRALVITDDLFAVRGYALAHADSVINLQNDFSPDDATKLAVGNRLGAAWMGVSAWYSAYFNPLGFGRRLVMQAIDLTIWRPRQIPVLGHFSLAAGLLRADVAGGGPGVGGVGHDYYDFADYVQLRYYLVDWLFLQYRAGLRTFDNRRALILDNSRLTSADGSTHNFGVVARTRNLWFGIFYFINLEKVNEVRNDLLRLNVTYEF
jgi:hypothetical protein